MWSLLLICVITLSGASAVHYPKCYYCVEDGSGISNHNLSDPSSCTKVVTCQSDQMCKVDRKRVGDRDSYELSCASSGLCTLLARETFRRMDECSSNGNSPELCGLGKRAFGNTLCTACCGDNFCNNDTCKNVNQRLYQLWKAGNLDMRTLTATGAAPTTTATHYTTTTMGTTRK